MAFPLENVPEMAAAVGADNLGPRHAKGVVLVARHRAGDAVKVGRPATARLELVVGLVQRRITASAGVDTRVGEELVVLAREGRLGALLSEDAELLCARGQPGGRSGWKAARSKGAVRALVQHSAPLVVGSLVGIRHLAGSAAGGAEEGAEERDVHR